MTPISLQGLWWLPKTPDDKKTGTLTFDQSEGAKLSVVGQLLSMDALYRDCGETRDAIYGLTTTGKRVTLLQSYVVESWTHMPGIPTQVWRIRTIAIGAHFSSADEALFKRSWVRFDGIAQWLDYKPFAWQPNIKRKSSRLTVRKPQAMQLGTIPGASFYTSAEIRSGFEGDERWSSTSEAKIAIHAEEPQTLNWHLIAASKLRSLAELLYGRPLHLTKLQVGLPLDEALIANPPSDTVEIHAQMIGGNEKLPPVDRPPMLNAPALLEAAPNAFANWFDQYETLSAALELLSTVASGHRMFINVRFLLAAQAIETYHRESCPGSIVPDVEHAAIVEALSNAIPEQTTKAMRDKLGSLLKYANEPSLRRRLHSLINSARDERDGAMPAYNRAFVDAVVNTRNYETHHGERPENLLTGVEIHLATERLVVLLTALFLRRLGLSSEAIETVIAEKREFRTLWTTTATP